MGDKHKTVAFRVDASNEIGTGHVVRCLALASGLRDEGAKIVFVCRQHSGHLAALVEERGFSVLPLPAPVPGWAPIDHQPNHAAWLGTDWQTDAEETLRALEGLSLDLFIIDHYALDVRWEKRMRSVSHRIAVVDDLADRSHDCDVLIDQTLLSDTRTRYDVLVPKKAIQLLGPSYALLQPDYRELRQNVQPRSGPVRRVLVSFGGIDRYGLTRMTVDALRAIEGHDFEADIVLSANSPDYEQIREEIAGYRGIRLHGRVPSLAVMMRDADLMIGAGGTTSWERLCLGLPAIVVTMASNQHSVAAELNRRDLVHWIGDAETITYDRLRRAILDIFEAGLEGNWSERCLGVVDGRGVDRVCAVLGAHRNMPITIRAAGSDDEALLLEWANDALTRQNAFNPKSITPEEHHAWFTKRLDRPTDCILYIAETHNGVPLGQIRFERKGEQWEISYALAAAFRGFGLGQPMLARAIENLLEERPRISLFGQVKQQNAASRKIFEALGFSGQKAGSDRYVFERSY